MAREITIVCGPTSSGKSDFVFKLSKENTPALIISADSRQFFRGLAITSGQDNQSSLPKGCLLVGQNFLEPDQDFSISQFKKYFYSQLSIFPSHHVFVVGGSGLYLKAITERLNTLAIPPNQALRNELEKLTLNELQEKLKQLDSKKFNKLNNSDIHNPRRLARAIEVSTYHQTSFVIPDLIRSPETLKFNWIGLRKSKEKLAEDVKKRVKDRLDHGAIEEVKDLLENYKDRKLPIFSTIGVKQIIDFIEKKIDFENLIKLWTISEIQYAKRQMTWFIKQPQIVWYDKGI